MDRFDKRQGRVESLARTRQEIVGEMAAALGRIARRLEVRIDQLHQLRAEINLLDGEPRSVRVAAYAGVRREAQRYLWYLRVQREAIGFTDHSLLDRIYSIPGALTRESRSS